MNNTKTAEKVQGTGTAPKKKRTATVFGSLLTQRNQMRKEKKDCSAIDKQITELRPAHEKTIASRRLNKAIDALSAMEVLGKYKTIDDTTKDKLLSHLDNAYNKLKNSLSGSKKEREKIVL